ncbi:peptidoglycan-binding domain-containing protein [Nannocystis pusilla]|uniref:peptidoglycan-binding domain-containing protein n=1 Tax=Nannocystis pusilla TaxID=889268 RepID=UPI003BF367D9
MPTNLFPDPNDPTLEIADTTPPGVDPDGLLSFEAPAEGDALDAAAFADEPWADFDPEAEQDDDGGPVSFGGTPLALADTSTRERWLQSALKALVAPALTVDGQIGPRTIRAVQLFQRRSQALGGGALTVDGQVGPRTLAALERLTGRSAPAASAVVQPPPSPAAQPIAGALQVSEQQVDGVTEYTIRGGGDEVRFSYWTPDYRNYKPYNVSRYKGARKGLLSDSQILAVGYSSSELKILQANALKESGGAFGAINTWDDQIVSWGMAQFAGQAGTLAALLAELRESPGSRASFMRWFAANGLDVARGEYPWKNGQTRVGWHVVVTTREGRTLRGNDGWKHVRTDPRLLGAFMLAGNDPAIQLGQVEFWRRSFLSRAIAKHVAKRADGSGGGAVRRFITSERGLAVLVRLHNWMPGYVTTWSNRFIAELQARNPKLDLADPYHWNQQLEDAFVARVCDERKRVKSGSYDTYALDLSRARGSFVVGRES